MTKISDTVRERIRENRRVIGRLVSHFDRHYRTIQFWIEKNDAMLTTPDAVRIISEETGLNPSEILEESEPSKVEG